MRNTFLSKHNQSLPYTVAIGVEMSDNAPQNDEGRLIGSRELRRMLPFSDAHFWRLEKAGKFPRRIKLGNHRIAWSLTEVLGWIDARKTERR